MLLDCTEHTQRRGENGRCTQKKKKAAAEVMPRWSPYLLLNGEDDVAGDGSWRLVRLAVEGDLLSVAHALGDVHLQHFPLRHHLVKGNTHTQTCTHGYKHSLRKTLTTNLTRKLGYIHVIDGSKHQYGYVYPPVSHARTRTFLALQALHLSRSLMTLPSPRQVEQALCSCCTMPGPICRNWTCGGKGAGAGAAEAAAGGIQAFG